MRGDNRNRTNSFFITQACGGGDFFMILKIFHENGFWGIKNCSIQNVKVGVARREKIFQMSSEFKICFGRRLWVQGYPQNQTGYPYDAWIHFYCTKRAEVAIFWISSCLKAILEDFQAKIAILRDFLRSKFWKNGENDLFYASGFRQISFRRVPQVQNFSTKCVVSSETAWIHF